MCEIPGWITFIHNKEITENSLCEIVEETTISFQPNDYGPSTGNIQVPIKKTSWKGLDKQDGKLRLYRHTSKKFKENGCEITRFTRNRLLRIAWKLDVVNPDGFARYDSIFFELDDNDGFNFFMKGWGGATKQEISKYIWSRLEEIQEIRYL